VQVAVNNKRKNQGIRIDTSLLTTLVLAAVVTAIVLGLLAQLGVPARR